MQANYKEVLEKLESKCNQQISQAHLRMDELASTVGGIRVWVDMKPNQLGVKVTQVDSKLRSLDDEPEVAKNNCPRKC
jgi:hypothetical protein